MGKVTQALQRLYLKLGGDPSRIAKDSDAGDYVKHMFYAIKAYVESQINDLPKPMVYRGSLGTGEHDISDLPSISQARNGDTYIVATAGTYNNISAKVADIFVAKEDEWTYVATGDIDTWRNIKVNGTQILGSDDKTALDLVNGRGTTLSNNNGTVTVDTNGDEVFIFKGFIETNDYPLPFPDENVKGWIYISRIYQYYDFGRLYPERKYYFRLDLKFGQMIVCRRATAYDLRHIYDPEHIPENAYVWAPIGPEKLAGIFDVWENPSNGQVLVYDSSNSAWMPRTLNYISNNTNNPQNGQLLVYDTSGSYAKWVNKDLYDILPSKLITKEIPANTTWVEIHDSIIQPTSFIEWFLPDGIAEPTYYIYTDPQDYKLYMMGIVFPSQSEATTIRIRINN